MSPFMAMHKSKKSKSCQIAALNAQCCWFYKKLPNTFLEAAWI